MGFLALNFTTSRKFVPLTAVLCGALCVQACQLGTPGEDGGTGGSATGGTGTGGSAVQCDGLDEAACYAARCWSFTGYPIDESADCYEATMPTFVSCGAGGGSCVGMTRSGRDEYGQAWDFPNGCAPNWATGFSSRYECGVGGEGGGP